ncbi:probable fructose-2,6-bisphosphatase TIGAR A [Poeciliopsis prolifica]|uniref:probable fructose-2,6-bisphosphatase TIGAR A n=1 Tax=Poeciliopsis prolifica TaxID=188132 RepID=UPI0024145C0F|nr:probable fructose-2,6-bisphosphatase TIGAR A [Poeciliopsis prolifica]
MKALRVGLTLVRHGETQYNKAGLLQGQAVDSSLSETGRQQAAAAGSDLRDVVFSNVFSSDMRRARQTAEEIMQQNSSCLRLQMVCDPLLKEKSFGVAEGGPVEDLRAMARAAGEPVQDFTPPEGETAHQVRKLLVIHRLTTRWQQTPTRFYSGGRGCDVTDPNKQSLLALVKAVCEAGVQQFMEKMLQQIGAEHWPAGGADVSSADDTGAHHAHALVVSHGAFMCVAVRYFVEELRCSAPAGCDRKRMFSLSPNAGICRFNLTVVQQGARFVVSDMRCVFMHRVAGAEQDE